MTLERLVLVAVATVSGCHCKAPQSSHAGEGISMRRPSITIPSHPFRALRLQCPPPFGFTYDLGGVPRDETISDLPTFRIDRTVTTCAAYEACVLANACPLLDDDIEHQKIWNACVEGIVVTQPENARAYCEWLGGRLPSHLEWQRAIRGVTGRADFVGPDGNGYWCDRPTSSNESWLRCEHDSDDGVVFTTFNPNLHEWTGDVGCATAIYPAAPPLPLAVDVSVSRLSTFDVIKAWGSGVLEGGEFRCVYPP